MPDHPVAFIGYDYQRFILKQLRFDFSSARIRSGILLSWSTTVRFRYFHAYTRRRNVFGQFRTVGLRNSARIVQTSRFAFSLLTRSLPHVCGGIAQRREISKVGSNPVRVASIVKRQRQAESITVLHNKCAKIRRYPLTCSDEGFCSLLVAFADAMRPSRALKLPPRIMDTKTTRVGVKWSVQKAAPHRPDPALGASSRTSRSRQLWRMAK
jgi:hypothetical protein